MLWQDPFRNLPRSEGRSRFAWLWGYRLQVQIWRQWRALSSWQKGVALMESKTSLLGEKTALEQTKKILAHVDSGLPKKLHRKLVLKIYDNQLKKYTNLNRSQRHQRLKNLGIKQNEGK